jgi:hypothetical protein
LSQEERRILDDLPQIVHAPVGTVHVALEAKSAMTEHVKAQSRLYDELNSSHQIVHGASDLVIAAAFVMINMASTFVSPGRNDFALAERQANVSRHDQPRVTESTIEFVRRGIPKRAKTGEDGFDAVGIVLIDCKNDGSPIKLVEEPPAPQPSSVYEYAAMIRRVAHLYEARFPHV